ncbi:hypothetical protein PISMIDRAFT_687376 [Pisolithus microcarpus 441]|uniref:Uncharacterized protein n=1 Tax=Pisolithus microcarpus 441 TaxID=765257 RepID=A0A0C9Z5S5_9AGAM|nr:hypothetical protein PISMIDRAFT_687376 [Pisolithus microcarpus 441]
MARGGRQDLSLKPAKKAPRKLTLSPIPPVPLTRDMETKLEMVYRLTTRTWITREDQKRFTDTCNEEKFYLACAPIELRSVEALQPMHASMGEILVGQDLSVRCITPPPPISPG